jgi:hypothetical protein
VADIFLGYSKADRFEVEKLAAYLESEGWSVWWDRSLSSGDRFRDEIMRQLAEARVAIVLWTNNSVKSDWVRAEAGRAKAEGKLIPTKTPSLTYEEIPLPFGEMHTEPLEKKELIRGAIVSILAKPKERKSIWSQTFASVKNNVFAWFGIWGITLTLFSGLKDTLDLSRWARWLLENWYEWSIAFWKWPLAFFNIRVAPSMVPALTLGLFLIATAIGIKLNQAYISEE